MRCEGPGLRERTSRDGPLTHLAAATLAAALVLASVPSVATATDDYGWGDCNWQWKADSSDHLIRWKYDPQYPFPANGMGDGVVNSFTDRVTYGMTQWNAAFNGMGTTVQLSYNTTSPQVVLSYWQPFPTDYGATTITTIVTNDCILHSTVDMRTVAAHIYITVRSDWFTQDNTRREYWETQCPAGTGTPYTCSKWWDFGSTVTHEVGHALSLWWHPDQVSAAANVLAQCAAVDDNGRPIWRHTMCPSNSAGYWANRWRSERRTLDAWDRDSLSRTFTNHD